MDRPTPTPSRTRHLSRWAALAGCALVLALVAPAAAHAQENYTFTVAAFGGMGGSLDADIGDEIDNTGFQIDLGMVIQPANHLVLRIGNMGLDSAGQFEDLTNADLTYATIGGEYRYRHSFYDSGLYLALGGYRLEGTGLTGQSEEETAVGLALGVTGDFPIRRWLSVQVELSGHYVDFDRANLYAMGHVGLAIHF